MADRRLRRRLAAGSALLLLVAGGCGVPGDGDPVDVGPGPNAGAASTGTQIPIPNPDDAQTVTELVRGYLTAAAGLTWVAGDGGARPKEEDIQAIRRFLTADATSWQPGNQVTVVNVGKIGTETLEPDGARSVEVPLQPVGVLNGEGMLVPPRQTSMAPWKATVLNVNGGLRFSKPPPAGILLSGEGLASGYNTQTIYFWDNQGRTLVPDVRYLSRTVTEDKRPTQIVDWLLGGPAQWIRDAVSPLPDRTQRLETVYVDQDKGSSLVVNLSGSAAGADLGKLTTQLRRSLGTASQPFPPVQIKIEGQPKPTVPDPKTVPPNRDADLTTLGIVGGKVQPVTGKAPEIIASDQNSGVVSGAFSPQGRFGALVRTDQRGERLWVGTKQAAGGAFSPTDVVGRHLSRPVYLPWTSSYWLVAADGALRLISAENPQSGSSVLTGPTSVSTVAIAPDGRRIAFIADDQVYVAALLIDRDTVTVGAAVLVPTGLTGHTGVAWSSAEQVTVSGRDADATAMIRVNVDGGMRTRLEIDNLSQLTVTQLTAKVADPSQFSAGRLYIETPNQAYQVFSRTIQPVTLDDQVTDGGSRPPTVTCVMFFG